MKTKEHQQNWEKLEPGDEVVVIDANEEESPGIVDAKTVSSEVIWILHHGGRGRRAFDHREGIRILRA
jgi:3,4-dihydroxy-2-butanone 4-phosphate synthase